MSQSVAASFNRQSDAQNNLGQSQDEAARLKKRMALEAKMRSRRGAKAATADGFGSQTSAIAELQEKAKAEGKLICITREVDKGQHRVSLEERLRSRRAKVNKIKKTGGFMGFGGKIEKTGKNDLYKNRENTELFQDLEEAAIEFVNSKKIPESWESLLHDVFCVDKLTDMEKARVIFHYITAQNLDDLPGLPEISSKPDIKNPGEALAGIKAFKITYSELYAHMCEIADLKCKIVKGKVKGSEWHPYQEFNDKFGASWNAVKVDGQYRIVDCHWGSRHISSQDCDDESRKIHYEYEEFYFFPEPDQIIATHFPNEEDQQYLDQSKPEQEFNTACKKWPMYHKLGVSTDTPNAIVKTKNGKATIKISVQDEYRTLSQLIFTLAPSHDLKAPQDEITTMMNDERQKNNNQYVFHSKNIKGENTFEINLPESGNYQLEICAYCPVFQKTAQYDSVCSFYIDCDASDEINSDEINVYWSDFEMTKAFGKTADVERHNLRACEGTSYETILTGSPGTEFKLDFDVLGEISNKFTWEILDTPDDNTANQELARFVQVEYQQKHVQIRVRLPNSFENAKNGNGSQIKNNYVCLKLYTNEQNGDKLTMFAHYLLKLIYIDTVTTEIQPYETSTTGIVKPEILVGCDLKPDVGSELVIFNVKLASDDHVLSVLQLLKDEEVCRNADLIIEKDLKNAEYMCGLVFPQNGDYSLLIAVDGSTVVARYEIKVSGIEKFKLSPFPFDKIQSNAVIDNEYSSYSQIDRPERIINNSIARNCKTGALNLTKSCGISDENFRPILLKVGEKGELVKGNTGQIGVIERESSFFNNDGSIELIFSDVGVYLLQLSNSEDKNEPSKKILFYVDQEIEQDVDRSEYYEGNFMMERFPIQLEGWHRYRVQCAEEKLDQTRGIMNEELISGYDMSLALRFKPDAVEGFNADEDIEKLVIMIKTASKPVMENYKKDLHNVGVEDIWSCEVSVPTDAISGQVVMVLKNGQKVGLLNYKCGESPRGRLEKRNEQLNLK